MRTDDSLKPETQNSAHWTESRFGGREDPIDQSFSGSERNKWFLNVPGPQGRTFTDLSTISGMDSISDGRVWALWDFNRDGRLDVALCNANAPTLNLFENQINTKHHFVAIKFVGGMTETQTTGSEGKRLSVRDGFGAVVRFRLNNTTLLTRELRCGEGFAGQNSNTLVVGIGAATTVEEVSVAWPSGITDSIAQVNSGTLLTLIENGPNGAPEHTMEVY